MQERVFNMICEGLSTDAIAARLGRSHSTVRNHIKLIFKALDVRSRAALVAKAARTGRFTHS
jgi:DNA-binding NarL/FixJ family response regulator